MWCNNGLSSEHLQPNFPKNAWRSLHKHLCKLDSNWCTACILFSESSEIREAVLNGPKHGDIDFLQNLSNLLGGKFSALLKTYITSSNNASSKLPEYEVVQLGLKFYNPGYKIELINGRTEILFEHCVYGTVYNFDRQKQNFEVRNLRDLLSGQSEEFVFKGEIWNHCWKMTISELKQQLKDDGPNFQAVDISYLSPN
jgi:hypothetical protein